MHRPFSYPTLHKPRAVVKGRGPFDPPSGHGYNWRMRRIGRILLLLGSLGLSQAAFENLTAGPAADALGGAYTALASTPDGLYLNPAGLVHLAPQAYAAYLLPFGGLGVGLSNLQASVVFPVRDYTLALSLKRFGASLNAEGYDTAYTGTYAEAAWTLSVARALSERIALGLNLHYLQFQEPRFGNAGALGLDLGLQVSLYRRWRFGLAALNLNRPAFQTETEAEKLPSTLAVGVAYRPFGSVVTLLEVKKDQFHPATVALGQQVGFWQDRLVLRGGVEHQGENTFPSLGFGLRLPHLTVDYLARFTPGLPMTHGFGLSYRR